MTSTVGQLGYDVVGSGPPMLLLPGLTLGRRSWDPIVDRLATEFRCITVDLPGQGTSPGPPCTLAELTTTIHDLVRSMAPERPFLVGQSMSAIAALFYAEAFPVAGLVAVDGRVDAAAFVRTVQSLEDELRGEGFTKAFEKILQDAGVGELPEPQRADARANQVVTQDVVVGYWDQLFRATPDEFQERVDRALEAVAEQTPVLAVFGRALEEAERTRWDRLAPHAEIEEWLGRGRLAHLATPGRFATRVARFARRTGTH